MSNYFLARCKELETRDPVVSYYCKYYAVKLMIEESKDKEVITKWLSELETQQKSGVEAIVNHLVGKAHVEQFAFKVFNNADNQYRQGTRSQLPNLKQSYCKSILGIIFIFGTAAGFWRFG